MKKITLLLVAALWVLAINNLSAQTPTLEAHFKFDGDLEDETNNYDLSAANAPNIAYVTGADGTVEGAITGFRAADYLETTANFSIKGDANRTVTAWIKTSAVQNAEGVNRGIVNMGHRAARRKFTLLINGDKVRNDLFGGGGNTAPLTGDSDIFDDAWHLLAVVFDKDVGDNGTSTIYVDGVSQAVIDWTTINNGVTLDTSARPLLIGNEEHNTSTNPKIRGFEGAIDDVRVYNGTLTQSEIVVLYNDGTLSNEEVYSKSVNVYPNPVIDELVFENDDVATVEIYNLVGQKLSAKTVSNRRLFLGTLSKGIYMFKLKDNQNKYIASLKVIKD